jgi:hypothetical protein
VRRDANARTISFLEYLTISFLKNGCTQVQGKTVLANRFSDVQGVFIQLWRPGCSGAPGYLAQSTMGWRK